MNVTETIAKMKAAGLTAEAIVTALECVVIEQPRAPELTADEMRAQRKREADRVRIAQCRATIALQSRDTEVKKEIPHTPLEKTNNNIPTHARETAGRGTRLPEPFYPDPAILDFARGLGFTDAEIKFEIEQFTDYWRGVPGAKGRKIEWQSTLRNRFRDEHKRNKSRFKRSSPGQDMRDAFAEVREELAGTGKVVGFRNNNWP